MAPPGSNSWTHFVLEESRAEASHAAGPPEKQPGGSTSGFARLPTSSISLGIFLNLSSSIRIKASNNILHKFQED